MYTKLQSHSKRHPNLPYMLLSSFFLVLVLISLFFFQQQQRTLEHLAVLQATLTKQVATTASLSAELQSLKKQDQYKINQQLKTSISDIESNYKNVVSNYQIMLDVKQTVKDTSQFDSLFSQSLSYLSLFNYSSASATLQQLSQGLADEQQKLAIAAIPQSPVAPSSNSAPNAGFTQQTVTTDRGSFTLDIVAGDLSSTKVIVDTASDGDCSNNCPTLPVGSYVARNNAFAGINGTFFCPSDYPSCSGKSGSFDTLLMNSKKHYFNSDNNVYSTVPAVIISDSSVRFVSQSLQWGRDTSPNAVIAMQPGLVMDNHIVFSGSDDPKFGSKGARNFIANKGNTVYIGSIFNATMEDAAHVLQTLGMQNAINLDEGGSTALWYGGYKVGPGRNVPNAILFLRK